MRSYSFGLSWLAAVVLVATTSCGGADRRGGDSSGQAAAGTESSAVANSEFEGVGLLRSIVPNKKYVTIAHEDIPGFMSAMTMPFAVRDTSILAAVSAGDSVNFVVVVEEGGSAFLGSISRR